MPSSVAAPWKSLGSSIALSKFFWIARLERAVHDTAVLMKRTWQINKLFTYRPSVPHLGTTTIL